MFDRLLLLGQKGQTLYFGDIGPHAAVVINYFDQNSASSYQVASDNPAEWLLGVTSAPDGVDEWNVKFNSSEQGKEMLQHQAELLSTGTNTMTEETSGSRRHGIEYAASYAYQFRLVTMQVFREYWRDPTYVYSKMALCAGLVSTSFSSTLLFPLHHTFKCGSCLRSRLIANLCYSPFSTAFPSPTPSSTSKA